MTWRSGARPCAAACAAALLLFASSASAKPRWNAAWETALCGTGSSVGFSQLDWCNAVRADVMLLRESNRGIDLGPTLRLGTAGFEDFRVDAGVSLLLPLTESFPLVLEAGPHFRNASELGIFGSAFFGLRSFNYYGHYEMSAGLAVIAERSFAEGTPSALWLAARVDGSWLALPFILGYNALR